MLVYCNGLYLSGLTSLCIMGSSFIHLIRTDSDVLFLISSTNEARIYNGKKTTSLAAPKGLANSEVNSRSSENMKHSIQ